LWIYIGIWLAVKIKFRAINIEPGGFLSMGECLVFLTKLEGERSEAGRKKLTEHEVTEVLLLGNLIRSDRKALDVSGGDQ
jgi:hypothetical protein